MKDQSSSRFNEPIEPGSRPEATAPARVRDQWSRLKQQLINSYIYLNVNESPTTLKAFFEDLERDMIRTAMKVALGRKNAAAELLGIKLSTLCEKMKRHGVTWEKPEPLSIRKRNLKIEARRLISQPDCADHNRDF